MIPLGPLGPENRMTMYLLKTAIPRTVTCLLVLSSLLVLGAKPNATGAAKAARAAKRAG